MKFYKYINTIPAAPSEGSFEPGDEIKVRKGLGTESSPYYWNLYKVAANGSIDFVRGITDDQNTRLERMSSEQISKVESITTGDIDKLKEDYTKAEIDQQFNDVRNFANSSRINLNGSTVLPVPPRRPDNTVIEDAWVRLAQSVTYTQAGGDPLTGIDGHETIAEWNNEDGEWVLVDMGALPSIAQDELDRINQSTTISNNLADKSKIIPLSYYTTTGAVSTHATYRRLPLIAVLPNTEYTVHGAYAGFIGVEFGGTQEFKKVIKSPVSGQPVTEYTFMTGPDTYFVGLNVAYGEDAAQYDNTIMFNLGKKMPYEAFGYIPDMSKIDVAYKDDIQPLDMVINDFYDKYFIFNGTAKVPVGQDVIIGEDGDYIEINARINGGTGSANWLGVLGINGTVANTFGFYNKTSIWLKGQTAAESYVRFDNAVPINDDFTKFHKIRLDVVGIDFRLSIDDEVVSTQAKISNLTINTIADAYNSASIFSNVDIKYVKLHNSDVDLTLDNLSSMPGAVNVSEGIAPKSQTGTSVSMEVDPIMEVKKTADTFEIFMNRKDGSYFKQLFKRYTAPYTPGTISFYDVWKLGGLFSAVKNADFDYSQGTTYVTEGTEWETAVQVDGEHVSGYQHGYEQNTSVIFLVDGVLMSESQVGNFKCRKIEIIEKSNLYKFDTTTSPIIAKTTKWTIERGVITIEFPEFKALKPVNITYRCYLGMASVVRAGVTNTAFNDVSYFVNDLSSISTNPLLSVGVQNTNPNTNRIWIQGSEFGFEMNVLFVDEIKDTRQMIVHNTTNKLYHIYCGIYQMETDENFSAKVNYKFY